ncbi:MAG TPA: DUF4254 domain-containing protein [Chitinophagaceae bacterium]|nr:DUF4254 domain-containing protein [Chitinophagaceae bacterium]
MLSQLCYTIFEKSIQRYHIADDIDETIQNPYQIGTIEHLLYAKNWIDTIQWHLEDIIRKPSIDPLLALQIKRRIDQSNQERTDSVEHLDAYFLEKYKHIQPTASAKMNTESPAWAIDRLSILALKIYHMQQEVDRKEATTAHIHACQQKLHILLQQQKDLSTAIDELLQEIEQGTKYMKVYKQMKMYNDPTLNPILYAEHSKPIE